MTAAPDIAPALAAIPPSQFERALRIRFLRATIGGLGTPCVTDYPPAAARTVMSLVLAVTGAEDEWDGCGEWPLGEEPMGLGDGYWSCPNRAHKTAAREGGTVRCEVCGITSEDTRRLADQARLDQRERDVQYLRAAARSAAAPLVPAHPLRGAADFLAAAPLSD